MQTLIYVCRKILQYYSKPAKPLREEFIENYASESINQKDIHFDLLP